MEEKIGINILIEREKIGKKIVYITSSPDINVFAEGRNIEEATRKFIEGVKFHLQNFPEDRKCLIKQDKYEMPMVTKIFL